MFFPCFWLEQTSWQYDLPVHIVTNKHTISAKCLVIYAAWMFPFYLFEGGNNLTYFFTLSYTCRASLLTVDDWSHSCAVHQKMKHCFSLYIPICTSLFYLLRYSVYTWLTSALRSFSSNHVAYDHLMYMCRPQIIYVCSGQFDILFADWQLAHQILLEWR